MKTLYFIGFFGIFLPSNFSISYMAFLGVDFLALPKPYGKSIDKCGQLTAYAYLPTSYQHFYHTNHTLSAVAGVYDD